MLDPANDMLPPPSSPTISSISSSDLDTESTGSFFHDQSTTLGSLMGVSFPAIAFRAPSRSHSQNRSQIPPPPTSAAASVISRGRKTKNSRKNRAAAAALVVPMAVDGEQRRRWSKRRWRWWSLCRDDCDRRPSSLGEYLEVERRFGDVAFFSRAAEELEGVGGGNVEEKNEGVLFADGRVLPPREVGGAGSSVAAETGGLCSFSMVSLSGICSGGGGWG